MADSYGYLASISAVLGGFAFSFLGILLTLGHESRAQSWTAVFATLSAVGLTVAALGWALMASNAAQAIALTPDAVASVRDAMAPLHRQLSLLFLAGVYLFLASLGTSGWVRSRTLGLFTSSAAALGVALSIVVLRRFIS